MCRLPDIYIGQSELKHSRRAQEAAFNIPRLNQLRRVLKEVRAYFLQTLSELVIRWSYQKTKVMCHRCESQQSPAQGVIQGTAFTIP